REAHRVKLILARHFVDGVNDCEVDALGVLRRGIAPRLRHNLPGVVDHTNGNLGAANVHPNRVHSAPCLGECWCSNSSNESIVTITNPLPMESTWELAPPQRTPPT